MHDLSPIPDAGWVTVRDTEYEALLAAEKQRDALHQACPAQASEAYGPADRVVQQATGRLYECPQCGRLLWRRPADEDCRSFALEPPAS